MKLTSEDNLGTRIKLDFFEEIYIYKNHIEIYEWDRQTKFKFTKKQLLKILELMGEKKSAKLSDNSKNSKD